MPAGAAHFQFARWVESYFSASSPGEKAALLAQGKELAMARREALAALIQIDPKHAIELAAPWKWREDLPLEITSLLEKRVSGHGNLSVFGAVPLEGQDEFVGPILRYATIDSAAYRAFVYGRRQHQISQQGIALHGIAINDALAVHEDPVRVLEPAEAEVILANSRSTQDPVCAVSGLRTKVIGKPTLVAYGNQILHLCRPSHVNELNQRLLLAEGGSYGLRGRGDPAPRGVRGTDLHGAEGYARRCSKEQGETAFLTFRHRWMESATFRLKRVGKVNGSR